MTMTEYMETQHDIADAYFSGQLTEKQLDEEMDALQKQWEEDLGI